MELPNPDFSSIRAVFFDLDDTLCGYWEAAATGLRRTFASVRPGGIDAETLVGHWARAFRGFSKTIKGSDWYPIYLKTGAPTRVEQMRLTLLEAGIDDPNLAVELSDVYCRERDGCLKLFPEAKAVLDALHPRYPLGLITNGPDDVQNQEIDTLGIRPYFAHILIEGAMGEGKPLLSVFRRAEQWSGCAPGEMLFVGNSYNHDIHPAIEAGWHTVWVRRPSDVPPSAAGETTEPDPIPENMPMPDAIVDSLTPLIGWLAP